MRADTQYNGSGIPGSGAGGNGSDGCAVTGSDRIQASTSLNGSFEMTLGSENLSNATGNVALVRISLTSGQSVTCLLYTSPSPRDKRQSRMPSSA